MNPLNLLHTHCGWSLTVINRITQYRDPQRLHNAVLADSCPNKIVKACFDPIMIEWGIETHPRSTRNALWKAYFPDTRPHIYHMLTYVHDQDLMEATGYSERVIQRILRQPRLHRRQVDRVRRFAIQFIDALGSKHRKHGPDPRAYGLYYALNDPKRQYAPGEIIED